MRAHREVGQPDLGKSNPHPPNFAELALPKILGEGKVNTLEFVESL